MESSFVDIWTIGYSIYSEWGLDFNPKTWRYSKVYTTDKILREEKQRIVEANTIDLTIDDDFPVPKQRKMTDFLKKVPFT